MNRLKGTHPQLLLLGFQLAELFSLLLKCGVLVMEVSDDEPASQLRCGACEFEGSLLVFTTPVGKFVSDFFEDRHGPQREIVIGCDLSVS